MGRGREEGDALSEPVEGAAGGLSEEEKKGLDLEERFEPLREIGRGGMGTVYEAIDHKLGRRVAIKILDPDLARDEAAIRAFKSEVRATAGINHNGIVQVWDIVDCANSVGYSMELLEGETLAECLASHGGHLPLDDVLDMVIEATRTLEVVHGHDIVHGDLKPSNVMLVNGHPKILDFGVARSLPISGFLTERSWAGTWDYVSPEQRGREDPDASSDVYSLSVLMYEAMTGTIPVLGAARLSEEVPGGAPPELDDVFRRGTHYYRDRRYASMAEFRAELRELQEGIHRGRITPGSVASSHGVELVRIRAGSYDVELSGTLSTLGGPVHERVRISKGFWLSTVPVTNQLWDFVMRATAAGIDPKTPRVHVTWELAVEFCNELSRAERLDTVYRLEHREYVVDPSANGYRLPTESEWELAALAGRRTRLAGGDDPNRVAIHSQSEPGGLQRVATLASNAYGLYDMNGNVWEWVWDRYERRQALRINVDPTGAPAGRRRVIKGGGGSVEPSLMSVMTRSHRSEKQESNDIGFRVARNR